MPRNTSLAKDRPMIEVDVRRSDYANDTLRRRVKTFLFSRHFPEFRNLSVEADDGSITLTGRLPTHYQKQIALDSCRRVAGVLELVDRIKVRTQPR